MYFAFYALNPPIYGGLRHGFVLFVKLLLDLNDRPVFHAEIKNGHFIVCKVTLLAKPFAFRFRKFVFDIQGFTPFFLP